MAGFLIVAGLTGSVLAFLPELDAWLNPNLLRAESGGPPLPLQRLVSAVEVAYPRARVSTAHFLGGPGSSQVFWVEPRTDPGSGRPFGLGFDQVFVDPADGAVLGVRDYGAMRIDRAHLMPFIYKLHYYLHLPGHWGDWLMGGVAIAWMFDCFVGFWLTLPASLRTAAASGSKSWWQRWRPAWRIKQGASPSRRNLDLHRVAGLWPWAVLFTLAMSGVYLNLGSQVFVPVVRLFGPVSADIEATLPAPGASAAKHDLLDWDRAITRARAELPTAAQQWRLRWVFHQPERAAYVASFVEPGNGRRGLRYEDIRIDAVSGVRAGASSYGSGTAADRFIAWQYPLHSGQVAGRAGQILVCVTGLVVALLSWTGVLVWAKKRRSRMIEPA